MRQLDLMPTSRRPRRTDPPLHPEQKQLRSGAGRPSPQTSTEGEGEIPR